MGEGVLTVTDVVFLAIPHGIEHETRFSAFYVSIRGVVHERMHTGLLDVWVLSQVPLGFEVGIRSPSLPIAEVEKVFQAVHSRLCDVRVLSQVERQIEKAVSRYEIEVVESLLRGDFCR